MMKTEEQTQEYYDTTHIGVLDGIRAVSILIIVWFHLWQQSWIMPHIGSYSLDWLPRYGYLFVDMMLLLSSYCLFLPYARSMVLGTPMPEVRTFYKKRVARIVPSYYFSLFIAATAGILSGTIATRSMLLKDLIPHLFFVHNYFYDSSLGTHMFGVLWTLAVEVQFYLIFPFLAKAFCGKPFITYFSMLGIGLFFSILISKNFTSLIQGMYVNHTLTFFTVYANGMLGAWAYVSIASGIKRHKALEGFCTLLSVGCIFLYKILCADLSHYGDPMKWQIDRRFILSVVFLSFILSTSLALPLYQKLWSNRLMRFLSAISFNLYIYHQEIAFKLKAARIPYYGGDTPPNMLGDMVWSRKYMALCIVLAFVAAVAGTYLIEKPAAKAILKHPATTDKTGISGKTDTSDKDKTSR